MNLNRPAPSSPACPSFGLQSGNMLGLGMALSRRLNDHTMSDVEMIVGLCRVSVWRIEVSKVTSIDTVLKACVYIDVHPFAYEVSSVPREVTETSIAGT